MKKLVSLIVITAIQLLVHGQSPDCRKVANGTFKSVVDTEQGKVVTMIYRQNDRQIEECKEEGLKMEFDVKWTSPCTYELSNLRMLKGVLPGASARHVLYVKILEVYRTGYRAEVSSNYNDFKVVMDFSTMN